MYEAEQSKWIYGGLTGICAGFFIALLGSDQCIHLSIPLFISAILFTIDLPILTAFTLAHIGLAEKGISEDVIVYALSRPWVLILTKIALGRLYFAFLFLFFYFSVVLGILLVIFTVIAYFLINKFFYEVHEMQVKKNE